MMQVGLVDYWSDIGNYVDLIYIYGSVAMCIVHLIQGPYSWYSKLLMIVTIMLAIRRTFNFLKIMNSLSPIVTMLNNVFWDLKVFLLFYIVLTLLFSLMYGVIGLGNAYGPGGFRDAFFDYSTGALKEGSPGYEYDKIGLFLGNIFTTVRLSMGDFASIEAADTLEQAENFSFWIIWFITVVVTCIIFLNFIVAEASASYAKVSEELENYIQ